jgi:hypothetical protein
MMSAWVKRWGTSVSLTALLAIALLWRGDTIIGGLIGALAVTRAVLFARLYYRRDRQRRGLAPRPAPSLAKSSSLTRSPASR